MSGVIPRFRRCGLRVFAMTCAVLCPCPSAAHVVLNEVLYDPSGADGGKEFVELYNGGHDDVVLAGFVLEFANGAVGDVWEARWRGGDGDVVGAGRRFLIADRGWTGTAAPDAEVPLGLQNGPDAVRLSRNDEVVDLVGYGSLEHESLYEGWPHSGATGGRALARRPDGADTDHNDIDWFVADEPTPGAPNVDRWSYRLEQCDLSPPALSRASGVFELRCGWLNDGLESYPAVGGRLVGDGIAVSFEVPASEPGAVVGAVVRWTPDRPGSSAQVLLVPRPGEGDTLEFDGGSAWAGAPPLLFSEIMAAPESGRPEWLELTTPRDGRDIDLSGWGFADDGGGRRALPSRLLAAGDRLVLTADQDAFAAWAGDLLREGASWPCPVADLAWFVDESPDGWPVLNNTAGDDDPWADRLLLSDPTGTVVDWAAWGGSFPPVTPGRSLERALQVVPNDPRCGWSVSTARIGATPGCPDSLADPGLGSGLTASPRIFGAGGTSLGFCIAEGEASWDLVVLDLDVRPVRHLGGDALGAGPRTISWPGATDAGEMVTPGPWLVLLRTRNESGRVLRRDTIVVVRDRDAP